jgi:hypothetical protein
VPGRNSTIEHTTNAAAVGHGRAFTVALLQNDRIGPSLEKAHCPAQTCNRGLPMTATRAELQFPQRFRAFC